VATNGDTALVAEVDAEGKVTAVTVAGAPPAGGTVVEVVDHANGTVVFTRTLRPQMAGETWSVPRNRQVVLTAFGFAVRWGAD